MKKVGYFFLSFLPLVLAIAIQFIAMFFLMGTGAIYALVSPNRSGKSISDALFILLTDTNFNACTMAVYSFIVICIFGIWYYRSLGGDFLPRLKTTFHPLQFFGIVILVPGTQFATSYIIAFISLMFPSWLEEYMELMESSGLNQDLTPFLFLYAVLVGPIAEELIFRGVTMRSIRRIFPFWAANIFQAVLFGLYHMNWLQGCYAMLLGLVLGYICEKGGSIYLSIFFHILYNFWGTVITTQLANSGINEVVLGVIMFVSLFISLAIGGILFHLGQKKKAATVKTLQIQES